MVVTRRSFYPGRPPPASAGGRRKSARPEAVYLIQRLTEPGQLVVDPYAGGGAFIAACKATNRRWLATERDEATALIARKRLAEMDRR